MPTAALKVWLGLHIFRPVEQVWVYLTLRSKASRCWKEHAIPIVTELTYFTWRSSGKNKAGRVMQHLSLAWRSLAEKNFVKSANAVAKLDLSKELWAKPLKMTLATWLAVMAPKNLMRLKAIAVMELLDEEDAMRSYLQRCERDRSHFWYSRHLQMVELHVHLLYPKLWESLEDEVRLFLQEVRHAAHDSTVSRDEDDEDDEDDEAPTLAVAKRPNFDRKKFNSELHQDLSRILGSMGIPHQNKIGAGPMVLDIHLHDMCIVEASAAWSYYLRSSHLTALARRRQEMLKAMGFDMAVIPHFRWEQLKNDDAKREFLFENLPQQVRPASRAAAAATAP
eukprot:s2296_g4.t1